MSYEVVLLSTAQRDLARLAPAVVTRVVEALDRLGRDFESTNHVALTGQLRGAFRLRVGDYRVVYSADHAAGQCRVHGIRHRRDVYR